MYFKISKFNFRESYKLYCGNDCENCASTTTDKIFEKKIKIKKYQKNKKNRVYLHVHVPFKQHIA